MDLVNSIGAEFLLNLQNGRPENGSRSSSISSPERIVVEIFSLEDSGEKRIFVISNIKGSMDEKTSVNSIKIPNPQPSIVLLLANVIPRSESYRRGGGYPPELPPTRIL